MINKRKRKDLLLIILMMILCVSIGYAFLSSSLNLRGQASIKGNNFDVHFENIQVSADSVEVGEENAAKITNPTEVTFRAVLNAPGDKYEFTVDVVNSGTVDAMIGDLDDIVLTEKQKKVLDYSITYKDGQPVNPTDGIKSNSTLPIRILVNYKTNVTAEDIQNVDEAPVAVTQALNYIQADEMANFIEILKYPQMKNIYKEAPEDMKSYYNNLSTITLNNSVDVPNGVTSWDISQKEDNSVVAYVLQNNETSTQEKTLYDLYIEAEGGILAPVDSSYLFSMGGQDYIQEWNEETGPQMIELFTLKNINGLEFLDTSEVKDMSRMFSLRCGDLKQLNVENFDTSQVTDMSYMFNNCKSLTSLNFENWNTNKVTTMEGMFNVCQSFVNLDLSSFSTKNVTTLSQMFNACENLKIINLNSFDTSNVTTMSILFQGCTKLEKVIYTSLNTSQVTSMSHMFNSCSSLVSLDLSSFDTSQVTNMSAMFEHCRSLVDLNISSFDTSQVTNMSWMFMGCNSLTNLNLSNFDTSQVTDMSYMFYGWSDLISPDLRSFDTSKVTNMNSMFSYCSNLTSLDLSNFKTNQLLKMEQMFAACNKLTNVNLKNFDLSKVTTMNKLFYQCASLESIDFSNTSFNLKCDKKESVFSSVKSGVKILVKDTSSKSFIESRLKNSNVTGTVTIASA